MAAYYDLDGKKYVPKSRGGEVTAQGALIQNPTKTVSGAVVHFTDGADMPAESVIVNIEPVQSGTGTSSPDNVRPISGWDSVSVTRSGKNLLKPFETQTLNGITLTNNDGVITLNGTATATATFAVEFSNPIPAGDYYWSLNNKNSNANVTMFLITVKGTGNPSLIASNVNSGKSVTITDGENNDLRINKARLRVMSGTTLSNFVLSPQLEHGTTATAYEPYQADTYITDLPETVYGGTLDVVNGVLTVDRAMVDLGTLNWTYSNSFFRTDGIVSAVKRPPNNQTKVNAISSAYPIMTWTAISGTDTAIAVDATCRMIVANPSITSLSDFQTAISDVQLCYELAESRTIQLTPEQVTTLLGTNNVWADSGDVGLTYRRDINIVLDELTQAIISLGGNV